MIYPSRPFLAITNLIHVVRKVSKVPLSNAVNYSDLINPLSKNREETVIGKLCDTNLSENPHIIYLAGGFPNPEFFPFESASFEMKNGQTITIDKELMKKCLQYGQCQGYPPLVESFRNLLRKSLNVNDWENKDLVVTNGSTDGLCRSIEMIFRFGIYFIAESPLFSSASDLIDLCRLQYIGIERDQFGMNPLELRRTITNLISRGIESTTTSNKILFINTISMNRSNVAGLTNWYKEMYAIAQEFNLFILEMDPHFLIHRRDNLPSFLNLDIDGRVLRFDSFSTLFGPGLRVGFVTGPKILIQTMLWHIDSSTIHASNISQMLIYKALEKFGEEGLEFHSREVKEKITMEQKELKNVAGSFLEGVANWKVYSEFPFLWFQLPFSPQRDQFIAAVRSELPLVTSYSDPKIRDAKKVLGLSFLGTTMNYKTMSCQKLADILKSWKLDKPTK